MQTPINSCVVILWFIRLQLDVLSKTDTHRKLKPKLKVESVHKPYMSMNNVLLLMYNLTFLRGDALSTMTVFSFYLNQKSTSKDHK